MTVGKYGAFVLLETVEADRSFGTMLNVNVLSTLCGLAWLFAFN